MDHLKTHKGISYQAQCVSTGIPYTSLMRWRSRIRAGCGPAGKPGPRPVKPFDLDELKERISGLGHVRKRTLGTGKLYDDMRDRISRRELQNWVSIIRHNHRQSCRASQNLIQWYVPGMVWSFDDMEYRDPGFLRKNHIHSLRDLSSRFIFRPLTGLSQADGERIAAHLEKLFHENGPPLFLKRDNGGNLNHHAVDAVMAKWMVIPVNSPPYYPQYNGSIEQTQGELKTLLLQHFCTSPAELMLHAQIAANTLNHRPRKCLNGKISCQVFSGGKSQMKTFNRRKRREIYDQILCLAMRIANDTDCNRSFDSAWRFAVQIWLLEHGYISMKFYEKCYPFFSTKIAHN